MKKKNNVQPRSLKIKDKIINDGRSIALKSNEFFGSIANPIDMKTPKSKINQKQDLRHANIKSLPLNPVTEKEIERIINNFSDKKAAGKYSILTHILKEFRKPLSVPVTIIIYISYMTGFFPDLSKTAHVRPFFEKGDQFD